jgi:hypothetical protein
MKNQYINTLLSKLDTNKSLKIGLLHIVEIYKDAIHNIIEKK